MSSATNKLVSALSEINQDSLHSYSNSNYASETSSSGFFSNITWQTWLIIILILAFLGINVFSYLEMGTKNIVDIFAPILKLFGYQTLETTKQTINTSATGTKAGVDIVANTTTDTINAIENNAIENNAKIRNNINNNSSNNTSTNANQVTGQRSSNTSTIKNSESIQDQLRMEKQINELEDWQQQNLQKALQDASKPNDVKPDDSLSRIQASNGSGKAGWCFIGEDRGFRTCSQIGTNDQCMSGDIFPSQEICMNPNLRP
jgi:hypothetical protein